MDKKMKQEEKRVCNLFIEKKEKIEIIKEELKKQNNHVRHLNLTNQLKMLRSELYHINERLILIKKLTRHYK